MSPYSQTLAHARLDALEALVQALKDADTPDEKRRCAVAIFNAPNPCDLDDTAAPSATGSPVALDGQPVPACNPNTPSPELAPAGEFPRPPVSPHPNSFPDYPELAHLTDDQILHASAADLMCLTLAAKCGQSSLDAAPGP